MSHLPIEAYYNPSVGLAGSLTIQLQEGTPGSTYTMTITEPTTGKTWSAQQTFFEGSGGVADNIPLNILTPSYGAGTFNPASVTPLEVTASFQEGGQTQILAFDVS